MFSVPCSTYLRDETEKAKEALHKKMPDSNEWHNGIDTGADWAYEWLKRYGWISVTEREEKQQRIVEKLKEGLKIISKREYPLADKLLKEVEAIENE